MSFQGSYEFSIDDKGRLQIPAEMRDKIHAEINAGAAVESDKPVFLVAAPGNEQNIRLYTKPQWEKLSEALDRSEMNIKDRLKYQKFIFSLSSEVELDKQGRIRVPAKLKQMCKISNEVVVFGNKNHIEIRDRAVWQAELDREIAENPDLLTDPWEVILAKPKAPTASGTT